MGKGIIVASRFYLALLCFLLLAAEAGAVDTDITLASPSDVTWRRLALIQNSFGLSGLPTTQSSVVRGVANPFPGFANISRVDQYTAKMSDGNTNVSDLYLAGPVSNGRMVALNPGHQFTCDWTTFYSGYNVQPLLQDLLSAGYSVLALNMPDCGSTSDHVELFATYGDLAMHYFHEPLIQALNFMDKHLKFLDYNMVGLSGGGWTSTTVPAIEPRIHISIAVAGSMPGVEFVPGAGNSWNHGDCNSPCYAEQNTPDYYTLAGYLDQYIMASYGKHRHHIQILNQNDSCCYGAPQWTNPLFDFQAYYGVDWTTYLASYNSSIRAALVGIQPAEYTLMIDTTATEHQFSPAAISYIISTLNAEHPLRQKGR